MSNDARTTTWALKLRSSTTSLTETTRAEHEITFSADLILDLLLAGQQEANAA